MCNICYNRFLAEHYSPKRQMLESTQQLSLIDWPTHKSRLLNSLVVKLKSDVYSPVWLDLAQLFSLSFNLEYINNSQTVIVFVPGSQASRRHAQYFAQGLSSNLNVKVIDCLVWSEQVLEQKTLNKKERQKRVLTVDVEFTNQLQSYSKIVVVDDVVTTGCTLLAAQKALSLFTKAEIEFWVCFKRLEFNID